MSKYVKPSIRLVPTAMGLTESAEGGALSECLDETGIFSHGTDLFERCIIFLRPTSILL